MEKNTPAITSANRANKYCLFPIQYQNLWQLGKKAAASFWVVEEICAMTKDRDDVAKMSEAEQNFIFTVLGFFSASDLLVNENLVCRFMQDVDIPEAQYFYAIQIAIEAIHSETYATLIDTLFLDKKK